MKGWFKLQSTVESPVQSPSIIVWHTPTKHNVRTLGHVASTRALLNVIYNSGFYSTVLRRCTTCRSKTNHSSRFILFQIIKDSRRSRPAHTPRVTPLDLPAYSPRFTVTLRAVGRHLKYFALIRSCLVSVRRLLSCGARYCIVHPPSAWVVRLTVRTLDLTEFSVSYVTVFVPSDELWNRCNVNPGVGQSEFKEEPRNPDR